ncbi:MAG: CsbD family protein [Gemmatimonadota bacterium]
MKDSTKDAAKAKLHDVKGTAKEKLGELTNNPDLETEGQEEQIEGKIHHVIGKVEKALGD